MDALKRNRRQPPPTVLNGDHNTAASSVKARKGAQTTELVAIAVEYIDRLIGSGHLAPGQRLIEADLIRELGIGRVPIREAMRLLAGDGVIDIVPNRGARIRLMGKQQIAEMLKVLAGLLNVGIEEFVATPSHASNMKSIVGVNREIQACIKRHDPKELLAALVKYHQLIVEGSDNAYLQDLERRIHFHHYNRHVLEVMRMDDIRKTAFCYGEITEALKNKDATRACRILKKSLSQVVAAILD